MRILFVTADPLSRLRPRSLDFASRLAERHEVALVCPCRSPRDLSEGSWQCGPNIPVVPVFSARHHLLRETISLLLHSCPVEVAYSDAAPLREVVLAEVGRGDVALVHVDSLLAADALAGLPVPLVWDATGRWSTRRYLAERRGPSAGMNWFSGIVGEIQGLEERRMGAYLRHLLGAIPQVLVESSLDRATLLSTCDPDRSLGDEAVSGYLARIQVISSGVDLGYFSRTAGRRHAARLVFCGRMDDLANIAAVDLLVSRILPVVWRRRPDVQLTIAGTSPTRQVRAYARDARITVTGYVEDLRPYLAGATLAVSPLPLSPYPGGIRRPVLEAMALGTPLVVSESSTAGLALVPGRDLMMASSISRFAHLVLRLLDDADLRGSLAYHGHGYVRRYHALDPQIRRLEAVYSEVSGHNFALADGHPVRESESPLASGW